MSMEQGHVHCMIFPVCQIFFLKLSQAAEDLAALRTIIIHVLPIDSRVFISIFNTKETINPGLITKNAEYAR